MFYKNLRYQYEKEAQRLKIHIQKMKIEHSEEIYARDREVYYRFKLLYTMYLDVKHVSEYLKQKCEVIYDED